MRRVSSTIRKALRGVRLSEAILAAFFLYTTALALGLPISHEMRLRVFVTDASIVLAYVLLARLRSRWKADWTTVLRDLIPLALMLVAYKEMGWFAPDTHNYSLEHLWIVPDRLILRQLGLKAAIEMFGAFLPSLLEVCYSLVYALPLFCVVMLYVNGRSHCMDQLLTIYLLGLFLSYVQFPFWPSEPPRTVFPGEDLPAITTIFRRFNLGLLGSQGIHTSVFPSAHVSGAFAGAFALFGLLAHRRWIACGTLLYAILVAVATVYGRYHYAADAVAGLAVAVVAYGVGRALLAAVWYDFSTGTIKWPGASNGQMDKKIVSGITGSARRGGRTRG
jgi:membrane-associated phospholipid phosphatase